MIILKEGMPIFRSVTQSILNVSHSSLDYQCREQTNQRKVWVGECNLARDSSQFVKDRYFIAQYDQIDIHLERAMSRASENLHNKNFLAAKVSQKRGAQFSESQLLSRVFKV